MTMNTDDDVEPEQRFTISELAKEFSVTLRALRFYEKKGLLNPIRKGKYRSFDRRDRARLQLVLLGKRADFTLIEIKEMIDLYDRNDGGKAQRCVAVTKLRQQARYLEQLVCDKSQAIEEIHEMCEMLEQMDQPQRKLG